MAREVLLCLRPQPGEVAIDCTLGGGGHARALIDRLMPGGHLIGLDVDPEELSKTAAHLRDEGIGADTFSARRANFTELPAVLKGVALPGANVILADLGVSSMQSSDPTRGFSYKVPGPLDMRMDPSRGEPAWRVIERSTEEELAALLTANADEPQARPIARILKQSSVTTTHTAERLIRTGLSQMLPAAPKAAIKMSVRRTFQALRIAVNDEFAALESLLQILPACLVPGGRVAILTFHSGEDRRVKHAFRAGLRAGIYSDIAHPVVRSGKEETFSDRRAAAAKLRWAVRA